MDYGKMMGVDTTSYPLWPKPIPGKPIKIKDKTYEKGIGAPYGDIVIMLDGKYASFESDIGVQSGSQGIGVFKVVVDGNVVYESGEMTENDPPRHISIPLNGAQKLVLGAYGLPEVNWADAKLYHAENAPIFEQVDMAPFARICTWDPARTTGVSVSRLEEFPAEDVFTETEIAPKKGLYTVPEDKNGIGCIGMQWLERRRLSEFGLEFENKDSMPSPDGVRVEAWVIKDPLVLDGYSEWQGKWMPMNGSIEENDTKWTYKFLAKDNRDVSQGTYKIRWIFPPSDKQIRIKRFMAYTTSRWENAKIILYADRKLAGKTGMVTMYNGEIIGAGNKIKLSDKWDLSKPLSLEVKYTAPRPWGYDRTVIHVKLPTGAFGVAVDDIINNKQIYVKEAGFYVTMDSVDISQETYENSISNKETILQRVRKMPDQIFENSVSKLYLPVQDRSPTMLSLAFDNRKVIVDRFGAVHVGPLSLIGVYFMNPIEVSPQFGSGSNTAFMRYLDNDWMPMPHIRVQENDIVYQQSVCVAPFDTEYADGWLSSKPICLIQYSIENTSDQPRPASLKLSFMTNIHESKQSKLEVVGTRILALDGDSVIAATDSIGTQIITPNIDGNTLVLAGDIPPHANINFATYVPMEWEVKVADHSILRDSDSLRQRAEAYWNRIMSSSMKINIPDKLLQNIIMASQPHCMIASRNEDDGKNVDPWIASAYYCSLDTESHAIIRGMDMMGQHDYARRAFDFFVKRQNPAGYLSHGYTMMGTGQHIWFLTDHYRLTGDKTWWNEISPKVANICNWIVKQTNKTKLLDPYGNKVPEYGLVPPGTVADWQDWGYIYAAQGYYYAGLNHASEALDETNFPNSDILRVEAKRFRDEIRRAYQWTQSRMPVVPLQNGTWVPGSPYQVLKPGPCEQFFPNYSGCWIYDVELGSHHMADEGVFDPNSRQVSWMAEYLEDYQFLRAWPSGEFSEEAALDWFDRGGYPKAQPYYGRYPELCALRDDVKPFIRTYFNQLAPMFNREDLTIYENPGASVWNKTHETGHFLQQTRLMFLMERGNKLWLAPFVTNNWMKDGMTVEVMNAPSFFGEVGYKIDSRVNNGYIEATIIPPKRNAPDKIIIRLRHPDGKSMRKVFVDGKPCKTFDASQEIVTIEPKSDTINIRAEY